MKKNMEAQMQFQKELIIKQRQTQMAMQVALGRERFCYFQEFFCMVVPLCILGAYLKKEPKLLGPILPLSFAYAFQYDMFYGKMFERAQL